MLFRPATLDAATTADPQRGHTLDVLAVTVRYGNFTALAGVDLFVTAGEVLALLGPSGCGKTTLLRTVAGFVRQETGRVMLNGTVIDDLPPNRREVGIVFQNYALFPHMTVADNVAYGMHARRAPRHSIGTRVAELLEMVQMGAFRDRRPGQLSGGQQQRVALARALATEPKVLLLDEPFAALDRSLRLDMQIEIKRLQRQLGLTAILVTHDQDEAMSVADRIAVMRNGRIEQLGAPVALYDSPANLFVAGFIGTTNRIPCTVAGWVDEKVRLRLAGGGELALPMTTQPPPAGTGMILTIRPEHLVLHGEAGPDRIAVEVGLAVPLGAQTVREVTVPGGPRLRLTEPRRGAIPDLGATAWLDLAPDARPALFPSAETSEE